MQFSSILIAALTILGATAAPAPWNNGPQGGQPPSNSNTNSNCGSGSTAYCCDNKLGLLGLNCVLMASVSGGCQSQSICCQQSAGSGSTNNCVQQDGTYVTVPIYLQL